jgi:hypothetical protein
MDGLRSILVLLLIFKQVQQRPLEDKHGHRACSFDEVKECPQLYVYNYADSHSLGFFERVQLYVCYIRANFELLRSSYAKNKRVQPSSDHFKKRLQNKIQDWLLPFPKRLHHLLGCLPQQAVRDYPELPQPALLPYNLHQKLDQARKQLLPALPTINSRRARQSPRQP